MSLSTEESLRILGIDPATKLDKEKLEQAHRSKLAELRSQGKSTHEEYLKTRIIDDAFNTLDLCITPLTKSDIVVAEETLGLDTNDTMHVREDIDKALKKKTKELYKSGKDNITEQLQELNRYHEMVTMQKSMPNRRKRQEIKPEIVSGIDSIEDLHKSFESKSARQIHGLPSVNLKDFAEGTDVTQQRSRNFEIVDDQIPDLPEEYQNLYGNDSFDLDAFNKAFQETAAESGAAMNNWITETGGGRSKTNYLKVNASVDSEGYEDIVLDFKDPESILDKFI